jgi:signal peptidase II
MTRARAALFTTILLLCAGCDQAAKQVAEATLSGRGVIVLLGDTLRLELVHNPGAFLSLGALFPEALRHLLFVVVGPLGLGLLCYFSLRGGLLARPAALVGLALIAGGGLGNWLDRILQAGTVTDFVSFGIGPLRTGIFNAADVFIVIGCMLLLFRPASTGDPA